MKKFFAILLALCLFTGVALAEAVEINWSDVEASVTEAGIEGDFAAISDIGVKMFIPTVFQDVELSDEDVADGFICYLTTEDQSGNVLVFYADAEGLSLEDFAAGLPEAGATDVELGTLNGIPVVTYAQADNDSVNVSMMTDAGNIVVFCFNPASDEGFQGVAAIMSASIQPV